MFPLAKVLLWLFMEQGKFYHVYNRGNNKQPIFFEEENYYFFLRRMKFYLSDWIDLYSYCLMPNHFHLFFRTNDFFPVNTQNHIAGIEQVFKTFFMSYAKAINERYARSGALFQQKFKKKEVNDDAYFSWIIQYIHLNPIKAGLCKEPDGWKFSSYPAILSDLPTKIKRMKCWNGLGEEIDLLKFIGKR